MSPKYSHLVTYGQLLILLFLFLWLAPSLLVARYAKERGQSYGLFLVVALLASWVVALIVVLLSADKREQATATVTPTAHADLDRIAKLAELHKTGALTDDEYAAEKARALSQT